MSTDSKDNFTDELPIDDLPSASVDFVTPTESDKTVLGEVDEIAENEVEENIPPAPNSEITKLPIMPACKNLIEQRIACLQQLESLENLRKEFAQNNQLPDNLKSNLAMQSAELKGLPELKVVREKLGEFTTRVNAIKAKAQEDANIKITPEIQRVWQFGAKQYEILAQRGQLFFPIIKTTIDEYAVNEPLFMVCKHFAYDASTVFGLAIYQLALEVWQSNLVAERKILQQEFNAISGNKKSIFQRKLAEAEVKLSEKLNHTASSITCFGREIASLQKMMIVEYWKLYDFAACLLVSGRADDKQLLPIRALLRFGLLGYASYFIAPSALDFIKNSCLNDVVLTYDFATTADRVLYADEYLQFTAENNLTASIDENLELSGRNTPEWHNDKAMRRIAYSINREHALRESEEKLAAAVAFLRAQQEKTEYQKAKLIRSSKDFKTHNSEYAQRIQSYRVEAARFERIIERIKQVELPTLNERATEAKERLTQSTVKVNRLQIARKEATALQRVCRLAVRLKETFPPFCLRDYFRPENKTVNDRATVRAMLQDIEKADRHIFQEVLVNARKEAQRIYLRFHPVFLLTPNYGFVGYSWNPRAGAEFGKLVFPLYCPRQGMANRIMYNMLADFRWDTSKAAAGVDLLTSDTLVAAYAAVRWDYRKSKRENREKALIFNEINDRQNWRRHYELFLESAQEAGKKLFFKNPDVYNVIFKYIGLPVGCERLK